VAEYHSTEYNLFTRNCKHFVQDMFELNTGMDMRKLTSRIEA